MTILEGEVSYLQLNDTQLISLISASVNPLKSVSVLVKGGNQLAYKIKTYSNSSKSHLIESKIIKIIPNPIETNNIKMVLPINNETGLNLGSKSSYISMVNFNPVIDKSQLHQISNICDVNSKLYKFLKRGKFIKEGILIIKNDELKNDLINELNYCDDIIISNNGNDEDQYLISWETIFKIGGMGFNSEYWVNYLNSIGYKNPDSLMNQILTGKRNINPVPLNFSKDKKVITNVPLQPILIENRYTKDINELRDMVQIFQDRYLIYFQWFSEMNSVWFKYKDVLTNEISEDMLNKFVSLLQDGTIERVNIDLNSMDLSNNEKWIGYLNRWNDKVKDFLQLHNDIIKMRWDIFEKSLSLENDAIKRGIVNNGEEFWEIYLLNK